MITANNYTLDFDNEKEVYIVRNKRAPLCPDCGQLMSGYDFRKRTVIGDDGHQYRFLLRRLWCRNCRHLHTELPDLIRPGKRYSAEVIRQAVNGISDFCPADNSTIQRWKREK